jgi:hypothetical protein
MDTIIRGMAAHVGQSRIRIPNPVNPAEDFADKWETAEGRANRLEENFRLWLRQAKADFKSIAESADPEFITEQAQERFGSRLNPVELRRTFGLGAPYVKTEPKSHTITDPAKPWAE